MKNDQKSRIISLVKSQGSISSKELLDQAGLAISLATLKRYLVQLIEDNVLVSEGNGRNTVYVISPLYKLNEPINLEEYYEKEIDERQIKENFNLDIITNRLANISVFSDMEFEKLNSLQAIFLKNIEQLSSQEFNQEMERLAIDLSWKSSQIEGNTYSLLETERLLKEKETASGKTKDEAVMLLNHKSALDFISQNKNYFHPLAVSKIEDIHSLLISELGVQRNLRKRRVGISGTNYRPLDNEFQILEALEEMCNLINGKENVFEKAFLILVLISYIQPFMDGNKRTARIVSNALLMGNNHCPLSFRTVDSIEYKKAMLLFYEQNNISTFKDIFIEQYEFAVKTYF